jgi:folylpolyglutamate synthase
MLKRLGARQAVAGGRALSTMATARDYAAAVQALNSLQSNFSAVEAIRKQGPGWNNRALPEMRDWVRRIGYEVCAI